MKHEHLTYQIIGCAMEVHRVLGHGYPEKIYQRALSLEMSNKNLSFIQEYQMSVIYKGKVIGKRRSDFFVEQTIMVEIKAVSHLEDAHLAQAMNYCETSETDIGLLINFGSKSLQHKRVHNNKK